MAEERQAEEFVAQYPIFTSEVASSILVSLVVQCQYHLRTAPYHSRAGASVVAGQCILRGAQKAGEDWPVPGS